MSRADFITTQGTGFEQNGRPFRFAGANSYYVSYKPREVVDHLFDAMSAIGLTVLRAWAFLDAGRWKPGTSAVPPGAKEGVYFQYFDEQSGAPAYNDGPDGLERLDYVIQVAGERGLKLILPLTNNWTDFGGMDQYLDWFGLDRHDLFYTDPEARRAYRDWAAHLMTRVNSLTGLAYRDDPTILAWELANEPRCRSQEKPATEGCNAETILTWVQEMSQHLRELDSQHLIAVGDEGFFRRSGWFQGELYNGSYGIDTEAVLGLASIDFGTFHLYPQTYGRRPEWGAQWIREHAELSERLNKPVILEEYGLRIGPDGLADPAERDSHYAEWLSEVEASSLPGSLIWMLASTMPDGSRYPDYDHFTIYSADDAPAVAAHARRIVVQSP